MDQIVGYIGNVAISYFLLSRKNWIAAIIGIIFALYMLFTLFVVVGLNTAAMYLGGAIVMFARRYMDLKPSQEEGRSHESEPNQADPRGKDESSVG